LYSTLAIRLNRFVSGGGGAKNTIALSIEENIDITRFLSPRCCAKKANLVLESVIVHTGKTFYQGKFILLNFMN
jgi:hypothetical protein